MVFHAEGMDIAKAWRLKKTSHVMLNVVAMSVVWGQWLEG